MAGEWGDVEIPPGASPAPDAAEKRPCQNPDAAEKGSTTGIPCVICHSATTDQGHFSGSSVKVAPPPEPVIRNPLMFCKLQLGIQALASSFLDDDLSLQ